MTRKPSPPEGQEPQPEPAFEATMKRLSEIVAKLEKGDLPLEESLRLFEEGVRLSAHSQATLDAAQKRVEELLSVDDEGRTKRARFELRDDE